MIYKKLSNYIWNLNYDDIDLAQDLLEIIFFTSSLDMADVDDLAFGHWTCYGLKRTIELL